MNDIKEVVLPKEIPDIKHVYHLFVIKVDDRDRLKEYLENTGIQTGVHYPIPCHLQKAYEFLNYQKGRFPVSEQLSKEILSLPMYAELKEEEISWGLLLTIY